MRPTHPMLDVLHRLNHLVSVQPEGRREMKSGRKSPRDDEAKQRAKDVKSVGSIIHALAHTTRNTPCGRTGWQSLQNEPRLVGRLHPTNRSPVERVKKKTAASYPACCLLGSRSRLARPQPSAHQVSKAANRSIRFAHTNKP